MGGGNSRSTTIQSQKPLLRCFAMLSLDWSRCWNFFGWSKIVGNGKCDFLSAARGDRECSSCFWESCVSKYWKKRKTFGVSGTKSGKWLLKILRVLWYFYFATYVQFLVSSLTKQVAGMERVTHRILSQTLPPLSLSLHVTEDNRKLQCTNFYNVIWLITTCLREFHYFISHSLF